MNSFEQIKLEQETKEKIDEYQNIESNEEIKRRNKLDRIYGEKNPSKIDFWKAIWDEYNMSYNSGIPKEHIPHTAMKAFDLSKNKTGDIVEIGAEFALIIEDEPENAVDLDFVDNIREKTIYRLVLPEERPDLYVDNPKQFAERETWEKVWKSSYGDINAVVQEGFIKRGVKTVLNLDSDEEVEAAMQIGEMASAIRETDDGVALASERPREYWIDLWNMGDIPLGTPTSRSKIEIGVSSRIGDMGEAKSIVSDAIETGELYSPEDAEDNHYTINDPATDDGPEIKEYTPSEDDDVSGDSQEHTINASGSGGGGSSTQNGASTDQKQSESSPSEQSKSSAESAATESAASSRAQSGAESSAGAAASAESERESSDTESTESSTQSVGDTSSESKPNADATDSETAAESPVTVNDSKSTSQASDENQSGEISPKNEDDVTVGSSEDSKVDEDVDMIKQRHNANRQSEDELEVAVDVEGGVNLNDVEEEMNSADPHDRFNTYEAPDAEDGEYDPDREVVKQFVTKFCVVDGDNKEDLKVAKDGVFNAIMKWIEINSVEVDELSEDVYITNRKGNLKNILIDEYGVESKQVSIDGERVYAYLGMELSGSGKELLNANID